MFNQIKLIQAIQADLKLCKEAGERANLGDAKGREQAILEYGTLTQHLRMTIKAGNDQTELEKVLQSLERNLVVRYQRWRELARE